MKPRKWSVSINGQEHIIEFTGWREFRYRLLVDGKEHTAHSLNMIWQSVDHRIMFEDVACHFVVDGFRIDLAVNGKYVGSGKAYEPLFPIPVAVTAMAFISMMRGLLSAGGILSGILLGILYHILYREKKTVPSVFLAFFAAEMIRSAAWLLAELWLLD
ncbi:MAG: hypothetical protein NC420_05010 [Eubacterium sp.]|nr:hypothetical protein [Eubacterium sp.]MCM1303172.1 hypothetical protein [Butyrivibrio sp.]MCM1344226.1 hypothetical protein [Muribaculaceae bacterium]MCM1409487.1 hypothetical protein [Lachnospiraceae bacterium]